MDRIERARRIIFGPRCPCERSDAELLADLFRRMASPDEGHSSAGTGHDNLTAGEQYRAMGRVIPPDVPEGAER
jgi:hypothetical protein